MKTFVTEAIRRQITQYLQGDRAFRIEKINELLEAAGEAGRMELPITWDMDEPTGVSDDGYPALGMYLRGSSQYRRIDISDSWGGGNEVEAEHSVTLAVSEKNHYLGLDDDGVDSYEAPGRKVSRLNCEVLVSLIVESILDNPRLSVEANGFLDLVDNSVNVNYSDPIRPAGGNSPIWVCAAQITFRVRATQTLNRPNIGKVLTTSIETEVMKP